MLSVCHNKQHFILISKNTSESFFFGDDKGKLRTEYTFSLMQSFWIERAKKMLKDNGGETLGLDRFSNAEKRFSELNCHVIQDIINMFQVFVFVKARCSLRD